MLNAELSARYPEPGATHFQLDPSEVAPGVGAFVVARLLGRPVACGALRILRDPATVRELGPRVGELERLHVETAVGRVYFFAASLAIDANFATVFMFRAVPLFAAGIFSFDRHMLGP